MAESRLELASRYLRAPVLSAHLISLQLDESEVGHMKGQLTLDPNTCSVNGWGDHDGCTKMAVARRDATATAMKLLDPAGHHRILWSLDVEGASGEEVRLIEYPRARLWYLTATAGSGTDDTSVVPLFDAALFGVDPAGTVQTRYGVALRDLVQRGDVNEMMAEAEVVRHALDHLDAHPELTRNRELHDSHIADVRAALSELDDVLGKLKD